MKYFNQLYLNLSFVLLFFLITSHIEAQNIYSVTKTVAGSAGNPGSKTATPKAIPSVPSVIVTNNCGSSTLSTSATGSLLWSTGETTSSITVSKAGIYSVTRTTDGYTSSSGSGTAAPNAVPGKPIITAKVATTFCAGGSVTLSAPDGFASYLWSNGELSQSISVNETGSYSVTVSNSRGCASPLSDAAVVTVNALPAKPVVTANGATTFCTGGSVTLSAPKGFAFYLWSNGATSQSISVNKSGSYSVTVTNSSGCSTTSDSTVVTTQVPALSVSCMNGDKKQLTNNNIRPYLQVNNEGNTAFTYKELTDGEVNIALKESDSKPKKKEETKELGLTVLSNPVTGSEVEYVVKGAKDKHLQVMLTDVQGRIINVQEFVHAGTEEKHHLSVKNSAAGILFLRAGTQNQVKVVQVMRAK